MADYGLKGLGWFLCGMIVAPACYLVTSQVAAERADLAAMEAAIAKAHKDIRDLETEFNTRANFAQLQRWNGDVLAMAAPGPDQYLADAQQLASLDAMEGGLQHASLLVPADAPSPTAAAPIEQAENVAPRPAVRAAPTPAPARAAAPEQERQREPVRGPVRYAQRDNRLIERGAGEAVAMLDDRLLSAGTLAELRQSAQAERASLQ
ncbi:hypothetical protein [Sphingosinithalassobacter sp. CS137]|uniref:hypothetical protein n=1 Tax=Sphingosinithalassobacter sp. CS137 TaxID=2762748 RepID=UPI0021CDF898|nr:hypothetical protein [Sphingosinithalassobacter sp. CS137]